MKFYINSRNLNYIAFLTEFKLHCISYFLGRTRVNVKGRFRKKNCEIFGVYNLLDTARKYEQSKYFFCERVKKNLEKFSLTFCFNLFVLVL